MMRHFVVLTTIALLGVSAGHTAGSSWAINATAIEACSCPHFCMCYFNSHPAAHHDNGKMEHYCRFNIAYKINKGNYGSTDLAGAKLWLSGDLGSDFSTGQMDWVVVTFDKSVTPEQRQGIGEILPHVFPVNRLECRGSAARRASSPRPPRSRLRSSCSRSSQRRSCCSQPGTGLAIRFSGARIRLSAGSYRQESGR